MELDWLAWARGDAALRQDLVASGSPIPLRRWRRGCGFSAVVLFTTCDCAGPTA